MNKTYRKIAGCWLNGKPHYFQRKNEQYRVDWTARLPEVISGMLVQDPPVWMIEKHTRKGWQTVHRQQSASMNNAAIEAAEYLDYL